jgi:hypothetical protein
VSVFLFDGYQKFKSYIKNDVGKVPNSNQPPNHGNYDYDYNNNKHKKETTTMNATKIDDTLTVTSIDIMLLCLLEVHFASINHIFNFGTRLSFFITLALVIVDNCTCSTNTISTDRYDVHKEQMFRGYVEADNDDVDECTNTMSTKTDTDKHGNDKIQQLHAHEEQLFCGYVEVDDTKD